MELKDNPLLQPEDYMSGYRAQVEKLKNDPNLVQFDKLCYEVFNSEMGKKFIEYIKDNYLLQGMVNRNANNYGLMVIWQDGFKDAFRMVIQSITAHEQRIQAEVKK